MKLSVIVPAYREEARLPATAQALSEALTPVYGDGYEIIFVSDGSPDRTFEVGQALTLPHVRCIGYEENHGKGYAVRYGMAEATGEICLFTDCDLAYGTEQVLGIAKTLVDHPEWDLVVASRRKHPDGYRGYSLPRRVMSWGYYVLLRLITGLRVSDVQSGLKAFRLPCVREVFPKCTVDRFAFDIEVLLRARKKGFAIGEMPAVVITNGQSSIRLSDPFRMLRDMIRIKRIVKKEK